mmetsp:Transcript_31203/g.75319  ORF Transcript_31203/g.75319 Transcript_31203/m.75319 type:complete len:211 (-) Transcript_31203:196-828(-)
MLKLMGNSKDIRVKIVHSRVEDAVEEIASMRPWSISWSNVLDYMGPKTFHKLARKLSVHGNVIHFGYSMNWHSTVKGAHLVDYMLYEGNAELAKTRANIIQAANERDAALVCGMGLNGVLRTPPPENPMNTVSELLTSKHYEAWAKAFFRAAQDSGPEPSVANVAPAFASNPFTNYGTGTMHMTWTYDQAISFRAANPDLSTDLSVFGQT